MRVFVYLISIWLEKENLSKYKKLKPNKTRFVCVVILMRFIEKIYLIFFI